MQRLGAEFGDIGKPLAQATQDLAGDDAGIATGAHERAMGHGLAQGGSIGIGRKRGNLAGNGLHRERHVGSRVAIGNRKDVQAVDLLLARGELRRGGCDACANIVNVHGCIPVE